MAAVRRWVFIKHFRTLSLFLLHFWGWCLILVNPALFMHLFYNDFVHCIYWTHRGKITFAWKISLQLHNVWICNDYFGKVKAMGSIRTGDDWILATFSEDPSLPPFLWLACECSLTWDVEERWECWLFWLSFWYVLKFSYEKKKKRS